MMQGEPSPNAYADLGPGLPSRGAIYARAAELHALARLALEFSSFGGPVDLPRALVQFERMRAVLGDGDGGAV